MAIVCAVDFLRVWLNAIVAKWEGFTLHLFVNDYNPTSLVDFTDLDEASFPGYTAQPLPSWGYAVTQTDHTAKVVETVHQFTQLSVPSPVQTVYGYFVMSPLGVVAWAERNEAGPVRMDVAPFPYIVRPSMVLANLMLTGPSNVLVRARRRAVPSSRAGDAGNPPGGVAVRKGRAPSPRMRPPS